MNNLFSDLKERLHKPLLSWIKAIFWCIIYILFIVWVGTYWWLIFLPVVFDAFITHYIPWTWWKKSKNKTFLAIMGWVDAIVFALVAVYFINTYLFQNYQIPTPSLEKTLLVGDFLFVSKASYGPRVPNTPLSFPLVQHTFPVINTKSFLENPQWEYKRLKGFDEIERNDIVVFNFPTGDTVAVKKQNPDYYVSAYYEGYNYLKSQNPEPEPGYDACMAMGRALIRSNKSEFGEIVYRPVDRRENYVKRCVGLPGDRFEIRNNVIFINGEPEEELPGIQLNYYVQTDGKQISAETFSKLGISKDDYHRINPQYSIPLIQYLGMNPELPVYHFPMTREVHEKVSKMPGVVRVAVEPYELGGDVFPLGAGTGWNRDNYGPIFIPAKGSVLRLNAFNFPIYERIIRVYENNELIVKDGKFFINGVETDTYKFKMDYYWMMGDNRHNSADSRFWGFVPEDHVVGRPVAVWLSLNKDKGWFSGKIRFNRFFKDATR
jgi:signal peptidase I